MSVLLVVTILFLTWFALANYRRAERERKAKLVLEEESETFHTVLLDHLGEWKYWKDERDLTMRAARVAAQRGKIAREALEFVASRPSHPRVKETMVEIPGEACQHARDALASMLKVKDES